ncbi:unnamed protein product [Prorocentrum cordatum]|uniref:Methyltransferase type 11 domain-containing protein n=1 Tax=Prorocentrum cordatum TaxID=2364126 RepID=A0ABN9W3J5_9DINO|nr:unnamed protein product [Polarella glacialis]
MFVLTGTAARRLLGGRRPGGLLLDVGAGCGEVTSQFLPLFDDALATEVSLPALWCLRARGLPALRAAAGLAPPAFDAAAAAAGVALGPGGSVDCALLLNVLDRCDAPLALLRETLPGGILPRPRPRISARCAAGCSLGRRLPPLVLPYRPFVDRGARGRGRPSERLPLPPGASWEASVVLLWRRVLQPAGLELEALARAPYLSQGDALSPAYALDDAIFVLRRGRGG